MISRSAVRKRLSLVLSLVIVLWADTGLAMPLASGHGSKCHAQMAHMHQHATHSMPCCPSHTAFALTQLGDPHVCCDISSQPARPLAFLVAYGRSLSVQLRASGPTGTILPPIQSRAALLSIKQAPHFVRPVFELKTDLRI
ncbi:MAG: hypothetical protein WBM04_12995 [Candidatus Korobacteraceae bacterium]